MSHEIDITTGRPIALTVKQDMWHRLVKPLPTPPASIQQGMAMCGLDFPVYVGAAVAEVLMPDGRIAHITSPRHKALVRRDTNRVLSIMSQGYEYVPYAVAFSPLQPLIDDGIAEITTMGAIYEGRAAWAQLRIHALPQEVIDNFGATGSTIKAFASAYAAHDGSSGCELWNTDQRWECRNTIQMTRTNEKGISIPHRNGAGERLKEQAELLWGNLRDRYLLHSRRARQLKEFRPLTWNEFSAAVLDEITRVPQLVDRPKYSTLQKFDAAVFQARTRRDQVDYLWYRGDGHISDGSAWEAYNGAVQYLDHESEAAKKLSDSRLVSALKGNLRAQKSRIYQNLADLMEAA
jgi:phage/plasmid-like protein (TIGR03299 family)